MNPTQTLRELQTIPTGDRSMNKVTTTASTTKVGYGGGDGFKKKTSFSIASLKTSAGLTLTAGTTPSIKNSESNAIVVSIAANGTAGGSFTWQVPPDYDNASDFLELHILAETGGTTDLTDTFSATVYYKRSPVYDPTKGVNGGGYALSAVLGTIGTSAVVPTSTAHASTLIVSLSGNTLIPGDVLTINITATTGSTDAVNIYDFGLVYRSNLVFTDGSAR
jgi:hypothetical protein